MIWIRFSSFFTYPGIGISFLAHSRSQLRQKTPPKPATSNHQNHQFPKPSHVSFRPFFGGLDTYPGLSAIHFYTPFQCRHHLGRNFPPPVSAWRLWVLELLKGWDFWNFHPTRWPLYPPQVGGHKQPVKGALNITIPNRSPSQNCQQFIQLLFSFC